ncbi:unnamed protein product [Mytilus coruscus]|uniref:Fibrinogen C-terminal domain-containing protein n=1 Tax=Mytilus coruscus TaxID=42192 RepID=A0A6J8EDX7_MYTCO|nr:unnamed protein product [Mytilus coruscus]
MKVGIGLPLDEDILLDRQAGNQYKCINSSYKLVGKPFVICDKKSKKWKKLFCCVEKPFKKLHDCTDLPRHCDSGTYKIYPGSSAGFNIYCDNRKYWWNVFQRGGVRRIFGDNEFWLGNKLIDQLTLSRTYRLYVRMKSREGIWKTALYKVFRVGDATNGYTLEVEDYNKTEDDAGDSISSGLPEYINNGMKFSTYDRDNDNHNTSNCAEKYKGAWWFNACYVSHLNGVYDQNLIYPFGIQWENSPEPYVSVSWKSGGLVELNKNTQIYVLYYF